VRERRAPPNHREIDMRIVEIAAFGLVAIAAQLLLTATVLL
jgi:hypothetical protein